jgi:hypothetical protein
MIEQLWFATCATSKAPKSYVCKVKMREKIRKVKAKKTNNQTLQHLEQQGELEGYHTLSLEEKEK